jgi:hypothetical protein
MTVRSFVQIDGVLYEKGVDEIPDAASGRRTDDALWGDRHYDGLRAPDGTDISSRTKHREYMAKHGLTTADDFRSQWAAQSKQREQLFTTGDRKAVREAVERAIYESRRR